MARKTLKRTPRLASQNTTRGLFRGGNEFMMAEKRDLDFVAAAVGEVGMAWGHTQRALLHCRRSSIHQVSDQAVSLNEIGRSLEGIEEILRRVYREAQ